MSLLKNKDMKKNFSQQWLEILCLIIPETNSAMFLMPSNDNKKIKALAKWPTDLEQYGDFIPVVKYALKKKKQVCIPNIPNKNKKDFDFYALPVYVETELLGVIVLKVSHRSSKARTRISKSLQDGSHWLKLAHTNKDHDDDFYNNIVGLLASSFEQENYQEALIQLVTELTNKFDCARVAFSEFKDDHCTVVALSNSADFNVHSNLMQKYADAMDEAVEQDSNMIFPDTESDLIQQAHQALFDGLTTASLCTIPLIHQQQVFGVITLTRSLDKPFNNETINMCQQTLALITPFLSLKKEEEQSLLHKMGVTFQKNMVEVIGFKHLKLKLAALGVLSVLLLSSLIKTEFKITSDAVLEGKVQRVIAAPIAGYLISSSVQAGDAVLKGDVMAALEDTELKLELTKLNGQIQQARQEYRNALSSQDLVKVRIVSSQINQITAERDLTVEQLDKIRLLAPFDGVVIEGDLSKMLGSPVERGDTLFKIAPLADYRIILKVDERSISYVKQGQTGLLSLSSLPNKRLSLTIEKITAIASSDEGENIFRVEAALHDAPKVLRPGMEGVGKINAGQANLLWIWTHDMVDWLKLWFWSW
jgi:hypothetical protein